MAGAEASLLDTIRSLAPVCCSVQVALPRGGELGVALSVLRVRTLCFPFLRLRRSRNPSRWAWAAANMVAGICWLARQIRHHRIDIVHANSTTAQLYAGPAARLMRVPCVWHCRDLVDLGRTGAWLYGLASRTIAISDAVSQHLRRRLREGDRLVTIWNGIDVAAFAGSSHREWAKTQLGVPTDRLVVAMVAQLVPWKEHALFVETAARVLESRKDVIFLIIGDDLFGEHADYVAGLQALVKRRGVEEGVRFVGQRVEMARLYAGIDVLLHPASREPFGRVVLEAMAASKPVVAVNRAGPAEIIRAGETGFLVEPENVADMADATMRLLATPELRQTVGVAARADVEARFNLSRYGDRIAGVYEELLHGDRR